MGGPPGRVERIRSLSDDLLIRLSPWDVEPLGCDWARERSRVLLDRLLVDVEGAPGQAPSLRDRSGVVSGVMSDRGVPGERGNGPWLHRGRLRLDRLQELGDAAAPGAPGAPATTAASTLGAPPAPGARASPGTPPPGTALARSAFETGDSSRALAAMQRHRLLQGLRPPIVQIRARVAEPPQGRRPPLGDPRRTE